MTLLRTHIGQALRRARLQRGYTLRFVADAAYVSLGYLSEMERGVKEASSEYLERYLSVLDIPLSRLMQDVAVFALRAEQSIPDTPESLLTSRHEMVESTTATRQLRELAALGWSIEALHKRCSGVSLSSLGSIRRGQFARVRRVNADRIGLLYERLKHTPAPATTPEERCGRSRTLAYAEANGWSRPVNTDAARPGVVSADLITTGVYN